MNTPRRLLIALVLCAPLAGVSPAGAARLGLSNPAANIAPNPNFLSSGACSAVDGAYTCANPCVSAALTWPVFINTVGCTQYALTAINAARAQIGESALALPSNWYGLGVARQLFVIADMERVGDRYPPYLGLNAALSSEAQHAASTFNDPGVAQGFAAGTNSQGGTAMGGAWSEGANVLFADYIWMYDDGWAGSVSATSNIACTSARSAGCWGHRDELLGSDPGFNPGVGLGCTTCEMGTGYATRSGASSYTDLIEAPAGRAPAMTFTWARELAYFPGRTPVTTTDAVTTRVALVSVSSGATGVTTVSVLAFNTGVLRLRWVSRSSDLARVARVWLYRDGSCEGRAGTSAVAIPQGSVSGTLSVGRAHYFSRDVSYSTRVSASGSLGTRTSACVALGRA